ncbi:MULTISPECIES: IS66 family insertion sequence element accessory protein TnpB [Achromobacter]
MRAGAGTALARVVAVFGAARPHHAYCFANLWRANRMKVLVHDGIGVWLAARRLNRGKFVWADALNGPHVELDTTQWGALRNGVSGMRRATMNTMAHTRAAMPYTSSKLVASWEVSDRPCNAERPCSSVP